jgi:putative component of membrane protein insertase Oxa1/YidC/SpoIIIJ protein YidD
MKLISFLIILFSASICSQTDWERWGKAEVSYKFENPYIEREYSFSGSTGEVLLRTFVNGYWFFVSEVDGDNCPFEPSCSEFFIESVKETNIFRGVLMFADRFTRDINFYNRHEHYPRSENGRYIDPPSLYTMKKESFSDPLFP